MMQNRFDNTICAPATSRGGAVSVIRVSGMNAIRCVDKFFQGRKHWLKPVAIRYISAGSSIRTVRCSTRS